MTSLAFRFVPGKVAIDFARLLWQKIAMGGKAGVARQRSRAQGHNNAYRACLKAPKGAIIALIFYESQFEHLNGNSVVTRLLVWCHSSETIASLPGWRLEHIGEKAGRV